MPITPLSGGAGVCGATVYSGRMAAMALLALSLLSRLRKRMPTAASTSAILGAPMAKTVASRRPALKSSAARSKLAVGTPFMSLSDSPAVASMALDSAMPCGKPCQPVGKRLPLRSATELMPESLRTRMPTLNGNTTAARRSLSIGLPWCSSLPRTAMPISSLDMKVKAAWPACTAPMEAWGELKVTTRICMSVAFCTTLAIAWVCTLLTEPGGKVEMLTVCAQAAPATMQAALSVTAPRRKDFMFIVSSCPAKAGDSLNARQRVAGLRLPRPTGTAADRAHGCCASIRLRPRRSTAPLPYERTASAVQPNSQTWPRSAQRTGAWRPECEREKTDPTFRSSRERRALAWRQGALPCRTRLRSQHAAGPATAWFPGG